LCISYATYVDNSSSGVKTQGDFLGGAFSGGKVLIMLEIRQFFSPDCDRPCRMHMHKHDVKEGKFELRIKNILTFIHLLIHSLGSLPCDKSVTAGFLIEFPAECNILLSLFNLQYLPFS
jgi:hypothetical protein